MTPDEIDSKIELLDRRIRASRDEALRRYAMFSNSRSLHSLHAHLGRNNNTFVDSVRTRFNGPPDFIAQWIKGLHDALDRRKQSGRIEYGGKLPTEKVVLKCLEDDFLREYTFLFLTRNFYRNYKERVREKPDDALWSVWFGSGNLSWGLVISPALRNSEWTNDKSQMRRERYVYWTIGHVINTGLVDPGSTSPLRFKTLQDFIGFYRSVLKRVSSSRYEQEICDRYLEFLLDSEKPEQEPLLIPEFRYAGKDKHHEYRIDFTVLNGHTFDFTGFELSPASTHVRVKGMSGKTQTAVNAELRDSWEREMEKRNAYYKRYGVNVITFTDTDLKDLDSCFAAIRAQLMRRLEPTLSVQSALSLLNRRHDSNL